MRRAHTFDPLYNIGVDITLGHVDDVTDVRGGILIRYGGNGKSASMQAGFTKSNLKICLFFHGFQLRTDKETLYGF